MLHFSTLVVKIKLIAIVWRLAWSLPEKAEFCVLPGRAKLKVSSVIDCLCSVFDIYNRLAKIFFHEKIKLQGNVIKYQTRGPQSTTTIGYRTKLALRLDYRWADNKVFNLGLGFHFKLYLKYYFAFAFLLHGNSFPDCFTF